MFQGGHLLFIMFFSFSMTQIRNSIKKYPNVTNFYFSSNCISLAGFGQVTKVAFEKCLQVIIFLRALSSFLTYWFVLELVRCTSENQTSKCLRKKKEFKKKKKHSQSYENSGRNISILKKMTDILPVEKVWNLNSQFV